jgi:hypothetical protein
MARRSIGGWLWVVGIAACGGDDGGGGTGGDDTSGSPTSTGGMTTSAPTTMTTDPGTDGGSATGTGDDAPPTSDCPMSSDGPGDAGSSGDDTGPATGSDSAGGVCEGPQANACLDCAVAACCTEWSACQADEGCACVIDCHVVRGGSLGNCESQCDHDGELYQGVFFCGQQSCLGTCEWDCC